MVVRSECGLDRGNLPLSGTDSLINETTTGREVITLPGDGVLLRGTFHRAFGGGSDSNPANSRSRVGILFLNSLSLPRAATGDSAVYWAESFANCGYPSFRFDLPGLGDTAGNIPLELLNFINVGGYAQITATKVKELCQRFGLSGVVLIGHCAGTVTAIRVAAACKRECKGLVLLDPYFYLPQAVRPKVRQNLSDWALRSPLGGFFSNIYDRVRDIRRLLRGSAPPRNANFPLLGSWREVATTGLPILILKAPGRKAPGTKPRVGEFDYLKYILEIAGRKSRVLVELIEGTDHSFANRRGRAAVQVLTQRWLIANFPLTKRPETPVNSLLSEVNLNKTPLDCVQR
jgi:pimeloyl-ACP methyl ester carboxylesterase